MYSLCQNVPTVNTEDTKSICVLDVQVGLFGDLYLLCTLSILNKLKVLQGFV